MFADLGHFTAFSIRVNFQPEHYFMQRKKIFWISPWDHLRFTRPLTSWPRGISQGAYKLARISTVIKMYIYIYSG